VGGHGPYVLLLGLVLLTVALGQLISNMATALIVIPIAVSAAAELDVSPKPLRRRPSSRRSRRRRT
jgi:di/tricarboxylate transporter